MDLNTQVFNAVKEGKLQLLKSLLCHKRKEEVKAIVSCVTLGTTPLIVACRGGFFLHVQFLLKECDADVEQVGTVVFDGETIEGASPLWCAAAAGYSALVTTLVRHGALINSSTKTNSTPLRAACFDGHTAIAKYLIKKGADIEIPNQHGHTCLMIACYKGHYEIAEYLLKCGADVNRQSLKGNTALHDCAESGNLEIFKMLWEHGAKIHKDSLNMTPLLSAAAMGHAEIVEYFIANVPNKIEAIDALELLGASFVDKNNRRWEAFDYWKRAMIMRYRDAEYPLLKPLHKSPISTYIDATETNTLEDLEELIVDPDSMRLQALLIRERILGPGHPDTTYYIRFRGAAYADTGHFDRCITLWMYALDLQQKVLEPLHLMTQNSLTSFAELFSYMISDTLAKSRQMPLNRFHELLSVLQRATNEIERSLSCYNPSEDKNNNLHPLLIITIHLVGFICMLQPHLSSEEILEFKKTIYTLVHLNPKTHKGSTLLHVACMEESSFFRFPILSLPSEQIVKLLLEVGAFPNAIDCDHNTALHIAALNIPHFTLPGTAKEIFKTLLNHGVHLDLRNRAGRTAFQIYPEEMLDVFPLRFLNLQCLCSQVIRKAGIAFHGQIPESLENFVNGH